MKLFKNMYNEAVKSVATTSIRNVDEIVQEIHDTFNSEGERLLLQAKEILKANVDDKINVAKRMSALGFGNTKEAIEGLKASEQKEEALQLQNAILEYSAYYPLYRFIDQKGVDKICEKYNLVCGASGRYIGNMPTKNLEDIERFKLITIQDEHKSFLKILISWRNEDITQEVSFTEFNMLRELGSFYRRFTENNSFYICAPSKDFNLEKAEIKGNKVMEIPDPVVLFPVQKGYLIVTAWGLEASDPSVTNSKMN